MKPNGMRAWRQQARRWRRKQNRANRRTGAPWIADGTGRWYRRQQIWFTQRPVLPARVYPCDFVVGMTQGARKRAVLREMQREDHPLHNYRLDYWEARALYRLGERLRPCPGCAECSTCEREWIRICDGSGVLPARGE